MFLRQGLCLRVQQYEQEMRQLCLRYHAYAQGDVYRAIQRGLRAHVWWRNARDLYVEDERRAEREGAIAVAGEVPILAFMVPNRQQRRDQRAAAKARQQAARRQAQAPEEVQAPWFV